MHFISQIIVKSKNLNVCSSVWCLALNTRMYFVILVISIKTIFLLLYFITTVQSVNNIKVISLTVNGILTSISRSKKSKVSKSGHRWGVAILILYKVPFEPFAETKDEDGWYALVSGKTEGGEMSFLAVCASAGNDFRFYRNIFDLLVGSRGVVVCGGDWNIRLNPRLDSFTAVPSPSYIRNSCQNKWVNLRRDLGTRLHSHMCCIPGRTF